MSMWADDIADIWESMDASVKEYRRERSNYRTEDHASERLNRSFERLVKAMRELELPEEDKAAV